MLAYSGATTRAGAEHARFAALGEELVRLARLLAQQAGAALAPDVLGPVAIDAGLGRWATPTPTTRLRQLTRREGEVAVLVARGLTNREIAEELVMAKTTADRHVANILHKLGLTSRTQLALWVVDHGLRPVPPR